MSGKFVFSVRVSLSDKGRIARLKRTGENDFGVMHKINSDDSLFPAFVDLLEVPVYGTVPTFDVGPSDEDQLTTQALYDMCRAKCEKDKAEKAAEEAERTATLVKLAKQNPMSFVCNFYGVQSPLQNPPTPDEKWHAAYPYIEGFKTRQETADLREKVESIVAAQDALIDSMKAKAEADRRSTKLAWIVNNGSSRLRRMTLEKIACDSVYREERLAKEYPGWRFDYAIADNNATYDNPRNCDDDDFALLDEARKTFPDAKLEFCKIEREHDFDDDGNPVDISWSKVVATSEFEGKKIVFGCDYEWK